MVSDIKRLALGTVQFGLDYGIANQGGKPSRAEVFDILSFACKNGIDMLDSAYCYGESEEIIGEYLSGSKERFDIVSKMPDCNARDLEKYLNESLEKLRQRSLYGYLVHKFDNILGHAELWDSMKALKKRGLVRKIGISLYKPEELEYLLNNDIDVDIVQAPYNLLDRRFERYFPTLKEKGVEIHIRSVFLQGLLLLAREDIKRRFKSAEGRIERVHQILREHKIPVPALCLCFVLLNLSIDKIIIGVDSKEQLKQNIGCIAYLDKVKGIYGLMQSLALDSEEELLPHKWK